MSKYLTDLVERVLASFAGGFLTVTGLDVVDVLHLDWKAALGVGAGTALVAFLKGLAAKFVGNTESASATTSV